MGGRGGMPDAMLDAFAAPKAILAGCGERLVVEEGGPRGYTLHTPYRERWKRPLLFGSVQRRKDYVACSLMPVYMFSDLLEDISSALCKRMQGKSCFNVKTPDERLFEELARLTEKALTWMTVEGYIPARRTTGPS